jgi:sugar/nucleoside kinase (ribokinase family)
MKIGIFSHIVLDSIKDMEGFETESLGGPSCYGNVIAKTFNFNVVLFTKIGLDLDNEKLAYLNQNSIHLKPDQIDDKNPTTRFRLIMHRDGGRDLFLLSKCSPINTTFLDIGGLDGIVLSPVIDEVSNDIFQILQQTKEKDRFIMLDPQGFLRNWNKDTSMISLKKQLLDVDIKAITAIKADENELSVLTNGIIGIEGMKLLRKKYNLDFIVSTSNNQVSLLHKKTVYTLDLKQRTNIDSTGLGDILTTGFTCSYLKEKDPLWGLCFGVGSVIGALDSKTRGLEKVPRKINIIERHASYYYNSVKFKIIE